MFLRVVFFELNSNSGHVEIIGFFIGIDEITRLFNLDLGKNYGFS